MGLSVLGRWCAVGLKEAWYFSVALLITVGVVFYKLHALNYLCSPASLILYASTNYSFIYSRNVTELELHPQKVRMCGYPLLELIWRSVICCKAAFSLTLAKPKRGRGTELGVSLTDWTSGLKMKGSYLARTVRMWWECWDFFDLTEWDSTSEDSATKWH